MVNVDVHLVPASDIFRQSCPIGSDSDSTCKSTNTVRNFVSPSPLPQWSWLQHYSHYQSALSMEKRHLQNLTVAELVNKFPRFYSVLNSITMFTRDTHWALCWATWIRPTSSHCCSQKHFNTNYFQLKSVDRNKYFNPYYHQHEQGTRYFLACFIHMVLVSPSLPTFCNWNVLIY